MERFATGGDYIFSPISSTCMSLISCFTLIKHVTFWEIPVILKITRLNGIKNFECDRITLTFVPFPPLPSLESHERSCFQIIHHLLLWGQGGSMMLNVIEFQLVNICLKNRATIWKVYTVIRWSLSHWRSKGSHLWNDFVLPRFDRTWIF